MFKNKAAMCGLLMVSVLALSACQTSAVQDGALLGGALGAGMGAIVGNQSGHQGEGALIGAGLGALSGALVGDAVNNERQYNQQRYQNARPVQAAPLPPVQVQSAPPAAGNAYYSQEYQVVRGPNGESYEQKIWVDRY